MINGIISMQSFGKKGEQMACDFLERKGYTIIHRNYRFKKSEIDIICRKNDLLVFVEVKTRSTRAYGDPESFVSLNQQEAIIRAAEQYVETANWPGDIRFDIVAITESDKEHDILHLRDGFY